MATPEYDIKSAFAQVAKCDFECEGGPLGNNTGWRWLRDKVESGPRYALGQWVHYCVQAEVSGVKISQWLRLCVVGIGMSSDTERQTYAYSLSTDPPQPCHYGSGVQFGGVAEKELHLAVPTAAPNEEA